MRSDCKLFKRSDREKAQEYWVIFRAFSSEDRLKSAAR